MNASGGNVTLSYLRNRLMQRLFSRRMFDEMYSTISERLSAVLRNQHGGVCPLLHMPSRGMAYDLATPSGPEVSSRTKGFKTSCGWRGSKLVDKVSPIKRKNAYTTISQNDIQTICVGSRKLLYNASAGGSEHRAAWPNG